VVVELFPLLLDITAGLLVNVTPAGEELNVYVNELLPPGQLELLLLRCAVKLIVLPAVMVCAVPGVKVTVGVCALTAKAKRLVNKKVINPFTCVKVFMFMVL
jgi:hypothetical protein